MFIDLKESFIFPLTDGKFRNIEIEFLVIFIWGLVKPEFEIRYIVGWGNINLYFPII